MSHQCIFNFGQFNMSSSSWMTVILIPLYGFVGIANSWVRASALLIGTLFWHYTSPHAPMAPDTRRLPSKARYLQKLEVQVIPGYQAGGNCPTCWDELDSPIRLGCRHYFCESCIRPWLDRHNHCPVYRIALYTADLPARREQINIIAHKLRVCAAVISIMTTILKALPCFWILRGWHTSFVPMLRCTIGCTSLVGCFDDLTYIVLSILMIVSAKRAITTHGAEWHRTQLSGTWNIIATIGWLRYCDSELRILSALSDLALRKMS
jgi:hypothetical protein